MIEDEQQEFSQPEHEEPLPEYGEIQGQKVRLAGLDYALLTQGKLQDRKSLMQQIKMRIVDYTERIKPQPQKDAHAQYLNQTNDQLTKRIFSLGRVPPSISHSSFYLFDTRLEFGHLLPEIISKRFGKMHSDPLFINHSSQDIKILGQLLRQDDEFNKLSRREREDRQKKSQFMEVQMEDDNADSDDIFGEDSQSDPLQGKIIDIHVGKKLDFGVQDDDIFQPKVMQVQAEQAAEAEQASKYDFLRKKRKLNVADDGYGECYAQPGPSLEQMKQLKKQGIVLFGDEREYVRKQHKYDINKDYEKIKRIIDAKKQKK